MLAYTETKLIPLTKWYFFLEFYNVTCQSTTLPSKHPIIKLFLCLGFNIHGAYKMISCITGLICGVEFLFVMYII